MVEPNVKTRRRIIKARANNNNNNKTVPWDSMKTVGKQRDEENENILDKEKGLGHQTERKSES